MGERPPSCAEVRRCDEGQALLAKELLLLYFKPVDGFPHRPCRLGVDHLTLGSKGHEENPV
ncbi:MAG: hypothetical protein NTV14_00285 [Coprothermobacterota bacterium]|nr:hypothetical protein [Coprothermobacterota bacterium]